MSSTDTTEPIPLRLHQKKPLVWNDWASQMQHAVQAVRAHDRPWQDSAVGEQAFQREGVLWVRNYRGDEAPVTDGGEPERE